VQFATAGGDMAWSGDGRGFYYTRYPQGTERPAEDSNFYQQVYYSKNACLQQTRFKIK
jgi:prolyl oligopeptidase